MRYQRDLIGDTFVLWVGLNRVLVTLFDRHKAASIIKAKYVFPAISVILSLFDLLLYCPLLTLSISLIFPLIISLVMCLAARSVGTDLCSGASGKKRQYAGHRNRRRSEHTSTSSTHSYHTGKTSILGSSIAEVLLVVQVLFIHYLRRIGNQTPLHKPNNQKHNFHVLLTLKAP